MRIVTLFAINAEAFIIIPTRLQNVFEFAVLLVAFTSALY
jgi:hypothetical protein